MNIPGAKPIYEDLKKPFEKQGKKKKPKKERTRPRTQRLRLFGRVVR